MSLCWMAAPGSFEAKDVAAAATEAAMVSRPSTPSDLQRRVRRLLILALSSLDLSDITTYQAVEIAVLYINQIIQLMQGKETLFSENRKSLAVRQWRQLQELLVASDAQHGPVKRKASDYPLEALKGKATRSKDRSAAIDGVYRPYESIRSLPAVYEAPDRVVR